MPNQPNIPEYLCDLSLCTTATLTPLAAQQSELFPGQPSSPLKPGVEVARLQDMLVVWKNEERRKMEVDHVLDMGS